MRQSLQSIRPQEVHIYLTTDSQAGASYRDIAVALFGPDRVNDDWNAGGDHLKKPRENYAAVKAKSTFPPRNAQTSRLWRITNAICRGLVLQLEPAYSILGLNRRVIRWMPDKSKANTL
jgi:hypothetical protein